MKKDSLQLKIIKNIERVFFKLGERILNKYLNLMVAIFNKS